MLLIFLEDIEIPDEDEAADETSPPHYDDVGNEQAQIEAEKIKSGVKLSKPLKSIMKKAEKEIKIKRRESDAKKRDSADGHSPRNSTQGIPASASLNGGIADPSMVHVSVVKSSSRTVVDQMEMNPISTTTTTEVVHQHRRTASYPEACYRDNNGTDVDPQLEQTKPLLQQPLGHMRDMRLSLDSDSEADSNKSFSTNL